MSDYAQPDLIRGYTVVDRAGNKIGKVEDVYLDDATGRPQWVSVKSGLFGNHVSLIPLNDASQDGDSLVMPFDKETVKNAPHSDPDRHITPADEQELYEYYGLAYNGDGIGRSTGTDASAARSGGRTAVGHDTSGPNTDDAMTRSEERLNVGTQQVEAGTARLRKYVTTENVTTTVPVRKEKVRLETEPITDENVGRAMDGPEISEEEHEVTLREERPVVAKEAVPVERVRLAKDEVVEEHTVSDDVRKEHIEADGVYPDDTADVTQRDDSLR